MTDTPTCMDTPLHGLIFTYANSPEAVNNSKPAYILTYILTSILTSILTYILTYTPLTHTILPLSIPVVDHKYSNCYLIGPELVRKFHRYLQNSHTSRYTYKIFIDTYNFLLEARTTVSMECKQQIEQQLLPTQA